MENYPPRVTLFEDQVYRWCYDMDLWHNRYMIRLVLKIVSIVLGIPLLLILASLIWHALTMKGSAVPGADWSFYLGNDLLLLEIVGGILLLILLLVEGIYAIVAAIKGGTYRIYFQMDETSVSLVRKPQTTKVMDILGGIAAVAELASGSHGPGTTYLMSRAGENGTSRFDGIGRIIIRKEDDVLDLRALFEMNQIYVPQEDFDAVKDFILARIPEKARRKSEQSIKSA